MQTFQWDRRVDNAVTALVEEVRTKGLPEPDAEEISRWQGMAGVILRADDRYSGEGYGERLVSAKSERAARMARANVGGRVAAGFPIVDEATLRLRLAEYGQAARRVEQAGAELRKLREHIVRRTFELSERHGVEVLSMVPRDWLEEYLAARQAKLGRQLVDELFGKIATPGDAWRTR